MRLPAGTSDLPYGEWNRAVFPAELPGKQHLVSQTETTPTWQ